MDSFFNELTRYTVLNDAKALRLLVTRENGHLRDEDGCGVIWHYMYHSNVDDTDLLHHFVRCGATLDAPRLCLCYSPLQQSVAFKKPKIMHELLFSLHYPVNCCHGGQTALKVALENKDVASAKILLDAGATFGSSQIESGRSTVVSGLKRFVLNREQSRATSLIIIGLNVVRSSIVGIGNGRDVLRMIGRCVWSTRGHE